MAYEHIQLLLLHSGYLVHKNTIRMHEIKLTITILLPQFIPNLTKICVTMCTLYFRRAEEGRIHRRNWKWMHKQQDLPIQLPLASFCPWLPFTFTNISGEDFMICWMKSSNITEVGWESVFFTSSRATKTKESWQIKWQSF